MKKLLFGFFAAVFVLAGVAWAQTSVTTINPNTDLFQVIPGGAGTARSVFATSSQILATGNYTKIAIPTSTALGGVGYSDTFANAQTDMLFEPSATLPYTYITLAANPSDGDHACMFSTATVTLAYISANTGQTINNAVTAFTANVRYCYLYSLSNATWDRSN